MNEDVLFKTLDLLPRRRRPRNFNKIEWTPLYKNVKPIATLKYNGLITLYTVIILNSSWEE